jgi:methylated-DNA-protein-cysteine methyltransferase-like protein
MDFEDAVIAVIRRIPTGEVLTYGEVAAHAGFPAAARAVGNLLRRTAEDLPWWRVVGAGLKLVSPDTREQAQRLRSEGWAIRGARLLAPPPSGSPAILAP